MVTPVAIIARRKLPAPAATPMAALTQTVAAVVRPWMPARVRMIAPAPRNPIPVTICAATRDGSPAAMVNSTDRS